MFVGLPFGRRSSLSSPAAVLYAPKLPVTYFTDVSSFTFGCSPDQWNSLLETAKMGGTNNYVPASRGCKEAAGLTGDPKKHSVSLRVFSTQVAVRVLEDAVLSGISRRIK